MVDESRPTGTTAEKGRGFITELLALERKRRLVAKKGLVERLKLLLHQQLHFFSSLGSP